MNLTVVGIHGKFLADLLIRSFELSVKDVQLDNYSETAISPVLLCAVKAEDSEDKTLGNLPFFECIVAEEFHPGEIDYIVEVTPDRFLSPCTHITF
jgi:hypothetical protein